MKEPNNPACYYYINNRTDGAALLEPQENNESEAGFALASEEVIVVRIERADGSGHDFGGADSN